jgi:hypothetical protein
MHTVITTASRCYDYPPPRPYAAQGRDTLVRDSGHFVYEAHRAGDVINSRLVSKPTFINLLLD